MFKLDLSPSYFYPVKLAVLDEDGNLQNRVFDAKFVRLSQEEGEELVREADAGKITDRELVDRVLIGWRGLSDAAGAAMPFGPQCKEMVLKIAGMRGAIVRSFFASQTPTESAALAAKN